MVWWPLLDLSQRPGDYENDVLSLKNNKLHVKQLLTARMLLDAIEYLSSEGTEKGQFTLSMLAKVSEQCLRHHLLKPYPYYQ